MSLFTDSDVITEDDLVRLDPEVGIVEQSENILVTGDNGILRQSWSELANLLLADQQLYDSFSASPGITDNHASAVLNTGVTSSSMARLRLNQIVTDNSYTSTLSQIRQSLIYQSLYLFFRSASMRLLQDRYDRKSQNYLAVAKDHYARLRTTGIPVVSMPLECPGAIHSVNGGVWSKANVGAVSGTNATAINLQVAITYVDQSRYMGPTTKGNAESGPSAIIQYILAAGSNLTVSIATLNPPSGKPDSIGYSEGSQTPLNATGWNIYVGMGGPLILQNPTPIPITTLTYTLATIAASGYTLGRGQYADYNLFFMRSINRA